MVSCPLAHAACPQHSQLCQQQSAAVCLPQLWVVGLGASQRVTSGPGHLLNCDNCSICVRACVSPAALLNHWHKVAPAGLGGEPPHPFLHACIGHGDHRLLEIGDYCCSCSGQTGIGGSPSAPPPKKNRLLATVCLVHAIPVPGSLWSRGTSLPTPPGWWQSVLIMWKCLTWRHSLCIFLFDPMGGGVSLP